MSGDSFDDSGAAASRRLARYLAEWSGLSRKGFSSEGAFGGLTSIELRYADPAEEGDRPLVLEAVMREGTPVIEVREADAPPASPRDREGTSPHMIPRRKWFDRTFTLGLGPAALPDIVERLRGTPGRLDERVSGLTPAALTRRPGDAWSIQEHAGHLVDLESLWLGRLDDLAGGRTTLRAADLTNQATWDADHNQRSVDDVTAAFRRARATLVERIETMSSDVLAATALHPRLEQPMSAVDLCFFVAEHDDHHLAAITALRRAPLAGGRDRGGDA